MPVRHRSLKQKKRGKCPALSLPPPPPLARDAIRSGEQPPQALVVSSIDELLEERSAAATEPGEVGVRFPSIVGLGVALTLDFELSRSTPLAPAYYAFDIVLGMTGTRDVDRRGQGLLAGVVHLIAFELGYVPSVADVCVCVCVIPHLYPAICSPKGHDSGSAAALAAAMSCF